MCADDFGSALSMLSTLKTHASISKLAACVAGLHLKAAKCVLVTTCIKLDGDAHFAISDWLRINVPDFAELVICSSGKYLGWHLGIKSTEKSFKQPLRKCVCRVHEVVEGKAPSTTSISRYNQRAVPVLSFVSQSACSTPEPNLEDLDEWAVHRIPRMPSNCM